MQISCVCAYDFTEARYRVFTNLNLFEECVKKHDYIIGFNNKRFDNKVLAANGIYLDEMYNYDILEEIWIGLGFDPDKFTWKTHAGYGLNAMCKLHFGIEKTGHGALAPVLWQQGRIGEVIDYCINDIKMTKMLFEHIVTNGYVKDPKDPQGLVIPIRSIDDVFHKDK